MSQAVLGSSDTLSGGVCTARLAGDALIIPSAVWDSDRSTLTEEFSSASEQWIAVHPYWVSK